MLSCIDGLVTDGWYGTPTKLDEIIFMASTVYPMVVPVGEQTRASTDLNKRT